MQLSPNGQKCLKIIHLLLVSIWFTSIVIMTAIAFLAKGLKDGGEFYMLNYIYHFIDFKILTPAAIGTFITGLVYSIFTKWGFFKHGWIIYKWFVTLALILIGTFYLGPMTAEMLNISHELKLKALENAEYLSKFEIGLWAGFINSFLLILAFIFSTLKPWKNLKR